MRSNFLQGEQPPFYAGLKAICPLFRLVIVKSMGLFSVPIFLNSPSDFKHDFLL